MRLIKIKPSINRKLECVKVADSLAIRLRILEEYPLVIRGAAQRVQICKDATYTSQHGLVRNAAAINHLGLDPYRVSSFKFDKGIIEHTTVQQVVTLLLGK